MIIKLSNPGKMPGLGWSIPARQCKTGGKLKKIEGSVCSECYALKGRNRFPNVQNAQKRRLERYYSTGKRWVDYMSVALENEKYFRWFDAGDLQTDKMLERIISVCKKTPWCKHYLPTREYLIVKRVLSRLTCPENLQIRLSSHMIDGKAPDKLAHRLGIGTARVVSDRDKDSCPAGLQGNSCQDCRACWEIGIENINYPLH